VDQTQKAIEAPIVHLPVRTTPQKGGKGWKLELTVSLSFSIFIG